MARLPIPLAFTTLALALLAACGSHTDAAATGGPAPTFTLQADDGTRWSLAAHRGEPVLLFFGYTHCADTCPTTLAKLAKATENTEASVAFVTVDPDRDTSRALHEYVGKFGGNVVGLTGSLDAVLSVESAYHVWAQRIPGKHGSGGYDYAHASTVFVIDSQGRLAARLDSNDSTFDIARALQQAT